MRKTIILLSLALVSLGALAQTSIKIGRSKSASAIIDNYLALADALVKEDSDKSASMGRNLVTVLPRFDASGVASQKKKEVAGIIKTATQQSKFIADNSGNIAKQREHFEHLTKSVKNLILITGSDRTLYQAYCPMYNNNKGGAWLSASKDIYNPYFGSKMLKCGSVQQEISVM